MDDIRHLSQLYKALGDETRLHLLMLLAEQEPESALCVGRLANALSVTPSAVSQHLRILKGLGLVRAERKGYVIHYYLDRAQLVFYQNMARGRLAELPVFCESANANTGKEVNDMCCEQKSTCAHPEKRKKAEKCSPEQIQKCHGDAKEHPCKEKPCK
jgi:ArsR family transcriptional regulator, arsenate/arsenite/antimonite-responsive transcriptional repressor